MVVKALPMPLIIDGRPATVARRGMLGGKAGLF
jgi:hypothetical protein